MVTTADLRAAVTALSSAQSAVDTVLTNTTGLGTQVTDMVEGSHWWEGPQGDDLRRHLTNTSSVALRAWQPLTDMASEMARLQTTAEMLAERLGPQERERAEVWAPSILVDGALDVSGHFDELVARRGEIDRIIDGIDMEWTMACRSAEGVLTGAASLGVASSAVSLAASASAILVGRLADRCTSLALGVELAAEQTAAADGRS